jgi:hypothetical protein
MFLPMPIAARREVEEGAGEMKRPAEKKKTTEAAKVLAASGLETYIRSTDGAAMVEIEAHCYLNAELLALGSGRGRMM